MSILHNFFTTGAVIWKFLIPLWKRFWSFNPGMIGWPPSPRPTVDYFETSDTFLSRRFNDFNPPQCTTLPPGRSPPPRAACLFQDASLRGACVTFNLRKHNFKTRGSPVLLLVLLQRCCTLFFFVSFYRKKAKSLSVDRLKKRCQCLYKEKTDFVKTEVTETHYVFLSTNAGLCCKFKPL